MLNLLKYSALTLVVVSFTSSSFAQKFPTFGLEKDLIVLLDTALTSSGVEKEVTIAKKKYKLNVTLDAFGKLFSTLKFGEIVDDALTGVQKPWNDLLIPFFDFYKDGLKDKNQSFNSKKFADALFDTNPASVITIAQIVTVTNALQTIAKSLTVADRKDLKVLTDLENDNVITKKSLSADKKTQTYQVDIGGALGTFTLTAV